MEKIYPKTDILPWTERYRPKNLDNILGNTAAISRLKVIAIKGNIPNLILTGPSGTGKTTSTLCLAKVLLGTYYKNAILELNASDDRGVEIVRGKIKNFAQRIVDLPIGLHKIVFLDEVDSMTAGAQQALRRILDIYSSTTRFVLSCNQINKIIEPIQSRCAIIGFTKLSDEVISERLQSICNIENILYTNAGIESIILTSNGDMRQALNNLQATYLSNGLVNDENVFKTCDYPHPLLISDIIKYCIAIKVHPACICMQKLHNLGYSPSDILISFYKTVRSYEPLEEFLKLEFLKEIGFTQMRLEEGIQTQVQLTGLLARLCKCMLKSKS